MKRLFFLSLVAGLVVACPPKGHPQTKESGTRTSDSVYVDTGEKPSDEGGGLLDLLPFVGSRSKKVSEEKLTPSPPPAESKPVLSEDDLNELKAVAQHWLRTSAITDPSVRKAENGKYFRDYIVFGDEYTIDVLRGTGPETPFVAHVRVKGDYFQTQMHDTPEEAKLDYEFNYRPLEFRVIFRRVEKWDYSVNTEEPPFVFRENWVFEKLQSRVNVETSTASPPPESGGASDTTSEEANVKETAKPQQEAPSP